MLHLSKGRQTKVKNIQNHFKDIVDVYFPVNLQESEKLGKILYEWVSNKKDKTMARPMKVVDVETIKNSHKCMLHLMK